MCQPPAVQAKAAMTTKARKLERKTRAAELDMEIMRAREANGLPVISPMLGLPPEKWECEFRDYLVALGDPRVADPEWLAAPARIREEQRRASPSGTRAADCSRDYRNGSRPGPPASWVPSRGFRRALLAPRRDRN